MFCLEFLMSAFLLSWLDSLWHLELIVISLSPKFFVRIMIWMWFHVTKIEIHEIVLWLVKCMCICEVKSLKALSIGTREIILGFSTKKKAQCCDNQNRIWRIILFLSMKSWKLKEQISPLDISISFVPLRTSLFKDNFYWALKCQRQQLKVNRKSFFFLSLLTRFLCISPLSISMNDRKRWK